MEPRQTLETGRTSLEDHVQIDFVEVPENVNRPAHVALSSGLFVPWQFFSRISTASTSGSTIRRKKGNDISHLGIFL